MRTFVDTGGWLAVVVQTDQYHDVGVLHYEALISRRERLFTSDYVLDETVTRLRNDPGARARYHIFCGAKAPWFEITDDLPQFAEYTPCGFD